MHGAERPSKDRWLRLYLEMFDSERFLKSQRNVSVPDWSVFGTVLLDINNSALIGLFIHGGDRTPGILNLGFSRPQQCAKC